MVLVINNDRREKANLCSLLESYNCGAVGVNTTEELILSLFNYDFDIVIGDDSLRADRIPAILQLIKNITPETHIMFLVDEHSLRTIIQCMKSGVKDVVIKPLNPAVLINRIKKVLHQRVPETTSASSTTTTHNYELSYKKKMANINPLYAHKMNVMKDIQKITTDLKMQVLNAELTFDEAVEMFEKKMKQLCPAGH